LVLERHSFFDSFFLGGFECSTHCRPDGTRLDLIAATCHDHFAEQDYRRLLSTGIKACRDGFRWHLVERSASYNFSSAMPLIRAARKTGMHVIWDLFHYGWPEDIDIFSPEFVSRFARYANAAARVLSSELEGPFWFVTVNEPSFFSWAGAEFAFFPPFTSGRGGELKQQLVRASIAGIEAVRDVIPRARFVHVDPLIHIVPHPEAGEQMRQEAAGYLRAQFDAWDMHAGYLCPELGGQPKYLDVIGCNYYVHNQWEYGGQFIERFDPRYRPLHEMLAELQARYRRPVMLAETGIEDERRAEWLSYVCDEIFTARERGIDIRGVCLYPILNHPGWADDRHCHNGLWDYCNQDGHREIYIPLAAELQSQRNRFEAEMNSSEMRQNEFSTGWAAA